MRFLVFALLACACASSPRPVVQATPATQVAPATQAPRTTEAPHTSSQATDSAERGSRVALPRGAERPQLLYFAGELSDGERRELEKVAPGVRVEVGLSREAALARASEAHGVDAQYATPEFVRAAKNLVWVQAQSAGVERYLAIPELARSEKIVLTNLRGASGPAIADHAFAMLLALTRDLAVQLAARERGAWLREGSGELVPIALQGRTLLVVGLGGIGGEIARRGDGFGMRVIATRRGDAPAPAYVTRVGKPGELLSLLPEADVVAIAAPLTPETEHLFDGAAFAAMKPGAYLVNVARGKIVDTGALLEALRSKKLAGACLDVTDPEPLPANHPLWKLPNVVITPHIASRAELTEERGFAAFRENLRRFDAGEPLLNVVDKAAGY
jgi:phosphoglycerate dehydrogenase-like enzyme